MKYINEFIKYKEYKCEKAIYRVNDNCGNTYYSDEYVNWLEEQLHIHDVSNQFYCELDGNWAHQRCKEQCNHCKEEFKKMISN